MERINTTLIKTTPIKPWFPFIVRDWLDSEDVMNMTVSERGVYITLLVHQWLLGRLPADFAKLEKVSGIERRILGRFLGKYPKTFGKVSGNPEKIANRKLFKLQTGNDLKFWSGIEESRGEVEKSLASRVPPAKQESDQLGTETGADFDDDPLPAKGRNQANGSAPQVPPTKPAKPLLHPEDCRNCHGSGWETYEIPSKTNAVGYALSQRPCTNYEPLEEKTA